MKRIFNLILIAGVTIMSYSCATPEVPSVVEMASGTWDVEDVFADFQGESTDVYSKFILERGGTFTLVLRDQDELRRGTWTSSGSSIVLDATTGEQIAFDIFYQDFDNMQLDQSLVLPSGTIMVTYMLQKTSSNYNY